MAWIIVAVAFTIGAGVMSVIGALISAFVEPGWPKGIVAFSILAAAFFAASWFLYATLVKDDGTK